MTSERGSYHPALNILIQGLFLLFIAIFIMKFVFTSELFSLIGLGKLGLFTLLAVIYVFLLSEDMAVMVFVIFIPIPIFIQLGVIGENWIRIIPGDLLLVLLLMRTLTQKQLKVPSGPVTLPLLSVILLGFLTLGKASLLLKATTVGLLSYLQSLKFLSYLLVALIFVHTTTQLKKITTTILVSCTFYTIFINWQRMKVVGLANIMTAHPMRGALFTGGHHLLFGWPGFYALFCAMIVLFSFAVFLRSQKHFPRSLRCFFTCYLLRFTDIVSVSHRRAYNHGFERETTREIYCFRSGSVPDCLLPACDRIYLRRSSQAVRARPVDVQPVDDTKRIVQGSPFGTAARIRV